MADAGVTAAGSGNVTGWADQSGHANDAAQVDNTQSPFWVGGAVNGKPAVRFTDAPQYLDVASSASVALAGDLTTFVVLKADAGVTATGGAVTAWADQSGNHNDATQPLDAYAPALVANAVNGKPALRFDGETRYLDVASSPSVAITADITSFHVATLLNELRATVVESVIKDGA